MKIAMRDVLFVSAVSAMLADAAPAQTGYADAVVLERIDRLYGEIPPLDYEPPSPRCTRLPNTMRRLAEGPELRIVMLGDSIVNDTSRSAWEHLLMRAYPKCKVTKLTSVRGSTGCWWYKDEDRVQTWVLDHQPDLVMIGGISNRDDVDSIREVIRQTRAGSDTEIAVMTGAFGRTDPLADKSWSPAIDPTGDDYRARLHRMATEEQVELIDLHGPWGQYIRSCGRPLADFKRDPIHANSHGEQVLGRILLRYFTVD